MKSKKRMSAKEVADKFNIPEQVESEIKGDLSECFLNSGFKTFEDYVFYLITGRKQND